MADRIIHKQVQLPLARAVQIALRSLRVRLGRSLLTLATIVMAIAFLTFIWITRAAEPAIARTLSGEGAAVSFAAGKAGAARTVWLLALSLLVCLVGISNAMLMSVMERFREIGTMKCLGALDSFILKLFFLESLFLGTAGAATGVFIGAMLGIFQLWHWFGGAAWSQMPWGTVWAIAGASVAIGLALTAAAALYPAFRAARMEPIAAMRIEV